MLRSERKSYKIPLNATWKLREWFRQSRRNKAKRQMTQNLIEPTDGFKLHHHHGWQHRTKLRTRRDTMHKKFAVINHSWAELFRKWNCLEGSRCCFHGFSRFFKSFMILRKASRFSQNPRRLMNLSWIFFASYIFSQNFGAPICIIFALIYGFRIVFRAFCVIWHNRRLQYECNLTTMLGLIAWWFDVMIALSSGSSRQRRHDTSSRLILTPRDSFWFVASLGYRFT